MATLGASALALPFLVREAPAPGAGTWLRGSGQSERYLALDGIRVRYVRAGRGPALVLLHGFGSSLYTWKDVLAPLSADHDVIALDFPGFGGSDQPANLDFTLFPRIVLALMDALAIERASLAGSSMGGAVSVLVAAQAPERIDRGRAHRLRGLQLRRG